MRLLVVCTGNVCRSPLAAALFASRLGDEWQVESAGTAALVGEPMTPEMIELARARRVLDVSHRSRQLTLELAESVDLILTAGRSHRRQVAELAPRVVRRTFTLREFARIAPGAARSGVPATSTIDDLLTAIAEQRRRWIGSVDPDEDDIVDPYGGDVHLYATAGSSIDDAVWSAARALECVSVVTGPAAESTDRRGTRSPVAREPNRAKASPG